MMNAEPGVSQQGPAPFRDHRLASITN